ncbi:MAG TPA: cyclodeaminase/cyclohydrolase family protein [Rhodoglobus sp.]|nr:cyclodeaminase/cyclohydrolase family protein [Rhodoglobus sp.]
MSALAESTGSPGGGAASALMLGIAAGLTSMVAGYSDDAAMVERARALQREALRLADADAAASAEFGAAFREGSQEAIRDASLGAARSSAELGSLALDALADLEHLAGHGKPSLVADVAVAFAALRAALAGARTNLGYDLAEATDHDEGRTHSSELVRRLADAIGRVDRSVAAIDDRAVPEP